MVAEEVGGSQGAVAHQVWVGGGRQADGEGKQGEGKPGRGAEEEAEEEGAEAAGEVLGPEGVSRPCRRQRSPCPLQKNMEKPVEVQKRVTNSLCLYPGLSPREPNPASLTPNTSTG